MSGFEPPKPYRITFDQRAGYLYVLLEGTMQTYEIMKRYWQEIADECLSTGCRKVLIEKQISAVASMVDFFQIASDVPYMGFAGVKVAFVSSAPSHFEPTKFAEIVATNRGLNVKLFDNVEEAEAWLLLS